MLAGRDGGVTQAALVSGQAARPEQTEAERLTSALSRDGEIRWCFNRKLERKMVIEFYCKAPRQNEE